MKREVSNELHHAVLREPPLKKHIACVITAKDEDPCIADICSNKPDTNGSTCVGEACQSLNPNASVSSDDLKEDIINSVGIVFESSEKHADPTNRFHKERPARIAAVRDALVEEHILEQCTVYRTQPNILNFDDIVKVHRPCYVNRLDKLSRCSCSQRLEREASQYQSMFLTPHSVAEAKFAAAALCTLTSRVLEGQVQHGFAVIRPPGHHAEPSVMGGYCLLNNVAIAAAHARKRLDRVAIIDWDVHHGNGTQSIFLDDPNVLYFSVHRSNFYPYTGKPEEVGVGPGKGRTVNVAWTTKGMGDDEYLCVWNTLLLPMLEEFQPAMVFVSAGFDAAAGDMGECNVTPEGFRTMTRLLVNKGHSVVCALEGGYVRSILGRCVNAVVDALVCAATSVSLEEGRATLDEIIPSAQQALRKTIDAQRPHWKCLQG